MFASALLILAGAITGALIGYSAAHINSERYRCRKDGDGKAHGPAEICDECFRNVLHQALRCLKEH